MLIGDLQGKEIVLELIDQTCFYIFNLLISPFRSGQAGGGKKTYPSWGQPQGGKESFPQKKEDFV